MHCNFHSTFILPESFPVRMFVRFVLRAVMFKLKITYEPSNISLNVKRVLYAPKCDNL